VANRHPYLEFVEWLLELGVAPQAWGRRPLDFPGTSQAAR